MEARVDGFDKRFDALERRFDTVEQRFQSLELRLDRGLETLDAKLSRYFVWLIGIQISVLLAVVLALVGG